MYQYVHIDHVTIVIKKHQVWYDNWYAVHMGCFCDILKYLFLIVLDITIIK